MHSTEWVNIQLEGWIVESVLVDRGLLFVKYRKDNSYIKRVYRLPFGKLIYELDESSLEHNYGATEEEQKAIKVILS